MFSKMLKFTMVLFVLMTLFVIPASILSQHSENGNSPGDGWGPAEGNKECKGEFEYKILDKCAGRPITKCFDTNMEFKVISETEGCVTVAYGYVCHERTLPYAVGTVGCKVVTEIIPGDEDNEEEIEIKCVIDSSSRNTVVRDFLECKDYILKPN